jgi:hypothetical protein
MRIAAIDAGRAADLLRLYRVAWWSRERRLEDGTGLARLLLDAVLADARLRDVEHVELYCRREHVPLYARFGFEPLSDTLVYMRRQRSASDGGA